MGHPGSTEGPRGLPAPRRRARLGRAVKRILIIHTGGTFGMVPMAPTRTLAPGEVHGELVGSLPELGRIADIRTEVAFNIDSTNMTLTHWKALARIVARERESCDGFVLIHGTDTMAYTASALSFMLLGLDRPLILTGSQRPLAETRSDARSNLVGAVELATGDLAEVAVFFGTRLYRGNRTTKISADRYDAFSSPNFPALAEVGVGVSVAPGARRRGTDAAFRPFLDLQGSVLALVVHPGLPRAYLDRMLQGSERAIVVQGYGPGNVPIGEETLLPFVESAVRGGKIVVMNTQCVEGRVSLDLYECGRRAADLGAVGCGDMTLEASLVKLQYLLGRSARREEVLEQFGRDLAGELTVVA